MITAQKISQCWNNTLTNGIVIIANILHFTVQSGVEHFPTGVS